MTGNVRSVSFSEMGDTASNDSAYSVNEFNVITEQLLYGVICLVQGSSFCFFAFARPVVAQ